MDLEVILAEEVESHRNTSEKLESHRRKDHCQPQSHKGTKRINGSRSNTG